METIPLIHRVFLRLDLLQSHIIEQFPNKIFYYYPSEEELPNRFLYKKFAEKIVIEKDLGSNFLSVDNLFFEETKENLKSSGLGFYFEDNESFINFFQNDFFQFNESIGEEKFNPSVFGNGMQIKIADEHARSIWDSLME
jgi:hypothetical protein